MAAASSVFLCVSIDCECDKGPRWKTKRPMSFEGISEGITHRLQPLFRSFGAKGTYLLSPEVIKDARSAEALRSLEGDHELGSHLHGEYAEPGAFEPDETTAFQRDYPREIERAKLTSLTDDFKSAFGRAPTSFRAGRFGIGESSIEILEDLGYTVESSVTPFMDWRDKHPALNFLGAPTQPYRPDPRFPARTGKSLLLEVPVTIRPRALGRVPFVGKMIEPLWLRPTHGTTERLVGVAKEEIATALAERPSAPVVLNCMFHNVEITPGTSPYAAKDSEARAILGRLGGLLEFARREGIKVIGLSDVPEILS
jgi:hypothetical protein